LTNLRIAVADSELRVGYQVALDAKISLARENAAVVFRVTRTSRGRLGAHATARYTRTERSTKVARVFV